MGAAKAVGRVIPEMAGKMTGMSFRIPPSDVSVVDLTARLAKKVTYDEICEVMRFASRNSMRGIVACTSDQVN